MASSNGVNGGGHWSDMETRIQHLEAKEVLLRRDMTNEQGWRQGLGETLRDMHARIHECLNKLDRQNNKIGMLTGALMKPPRKTKKRSK